MLVSDKIKNDRLKKCYECPFIRNNFQLFNVNLLKDEPQCGVCKCMVKKKASLEFAKCPKNKWEK